MSIETLVRPEIRHLTPYVTARQEHATVRLNANELPWSHSGPSAPGALNRYPAIRPADLRDRLASYYDVPADRLLVTRGSSEAIDLLVRACCRAGRDNIVVTPPTFAMYRVYADIQGAATLAAPLSPDQDFRADVAAIGERCTANTKLIFVCSPNNPTGGILPAGQILELARARAGRSIVVVDEAYAEFSSAASLTGSLDTVDNLVVLRTLSKALGLAGARCGAVMGPPDLIGWLDGMLAPYALATPVVESVLQALAPDNLARAARAVAEVVAERARVARALAGLPAVDRVWPSESNFLLVRLSRFAAVMAALRERRILVRDFPQEPALAECVRITVGDRAENELLLAALRDSGGGD